MTKGSSGPTKDKTRIVIQVISIHFVIEYKTWDQWLMYVPFAGCDMRVATSIVCGDADSSHGLSRYLLPKWTLPSP